MTSSTSTISVVSHDQIDIVMDLLRDIDRHCRHLPLELLLIINIPEIHPFDLSVFSLDFTCIEPYPRKFLTDGVPGINRLVQKKVEDVELEFFDRLHAGDILFIYSSHVSKTGSDVNYLFFEVLPRLRQGVYVHIHDIFLPDEYPKTWVIDQGRNWNEQYLLRAFLQYNADWEVVWAAHFMGTRHAQAVQEVFPRYPEVGGGGSFWIRRR